MVGTFEGRNGVFTSTLDLLTVELDIHQKNNNNDRNQYFEALLREFFSNIVKCIY